jgi:undecaprenyl diphosphate synthase
MIISDNVSRIDPSRLPRHVACIMDGNGRWATSRGLTRTEGHRAAEPAVLSTIDAALELGVNWLTLFAFSTENWNRPKDEVHFLMEFNNETLLRRQKELDAKGVRIRWIGHKPTSPTSRVPNRTAEQLKGAVERTRLNTALNLTIALDYGGRAEIVQAFQAMARQELRPEEIDEATVEGYLYDPEMPDVDLLIRTSGEYRVSNFLLWKIAYSEIIFTDTLWPDFRGVHLCSAILEYQQRDRRKGGLNP